MALPGGDPIGTQPGAEEEDLAMLAEGVVAGREWMRSALQKSLAWVEENPGMALVCAVAAGFVVGKVLLHRQRSLEDVVD
jgi:hypothetical protein